MRRCSGHDGNDGRLLRTQMAKLTFPWKTPKGVMVGYTAAPEVDAYFMRAVADDVVNWRNEAGIHPNAQLNGCTGGVLTGIVQVLLSFYLKHIMFVEEALKHHPDINQHMSLTIWKTRADLIASLIATGAPPKEAFDQHGSWSLAR
jgi:hypothetical protein